MAANDITPRIILTIETAEAEKKISAVKKELESLGKQVEKNIPLLKKHADALEENAKQAEKLQQAAAKAKEAQEKTPSLPKMPSSSKIPFDIDKLAPMPPPTYCPSNSNSRTQAQAEAAVKVIEQTGKVSEKAAPKIKKFSWAQLGTRSAARALKMQLGTGTNPNLIKMGIIAAGAASAMKLLQFALTRTADRMQYHAQLARENTDSMQSVVERNKELREEQSKNVEALARLNDKERLSNTDKLEMLKLVTALEKGYNKYGIAIDTATGKIINMKEVQGKIAEEQRVKRLKEIELQRKELIEERKRQKQLVDNMRIHTRTEKTGMFFGYGPEIERGVLFIPTQNDITKGEEATKRLNEISEEQSKLAAERLKLLKETPLADAEKLENALLKDKQDKYTQEIKLNEHRLKVQQLRNQGLMKEAKLAEINYQLDKERMNLAGKEAELFDKNRKARAAAQLALWEAQQTKKKEKAQKSANFRELSSFFRDNLNQYRATTQGAIMSGSIEAMRLRSRQTVNVGNNPAAETAKNTQKQADLLSQMVDKTNEMINKLNQITGTGVKIQNLTVRTI